MSHSDFELPGLTQTGPSMERWIVPTAWAYSSKCNNRRLEHPFHGVWDLIFHDLIADLGPYVFVVPQYQIDSLSNGPAAPDESVATAAQPDATKLTPDFSIVKAHVILRPTATMTIDRLPFSSWNEIAAKTFIVPFIAELKRPPTRRPPSAQWFVEALSSTFRNAYRCLEDQVENAFMMQSTNVDRIIMFACVGEWWSWKIATREQYVTDDPSNDILPPAFSTTDHWDPSQRKPRTAKNAEARRKYTSPPSPPRRESDKIPYCPRRQGEGDKERSEHAIRYEDLGADMEPVRTNVELAKPPDNDWSKFIRLGSPAFNQRLFLIHRFLGIECTTMLDILVRWLINVKRDIIDGPLGCLEQ